MAKVTHRQSRYGWLREHHLTPGEARMFSALPKKTPALQAIVAERDSRWERFMHIASRKVFNGKWKETEIQAKWVVNLARMYRKNGWLSKGEAKGNQPKIPKGQPSPWTMYRAYEKESPDKGYVSPWQIAQIANGKTPFDRGQIFLKKSETTSNEDQIRNWISQLNESIRMSSGEQRRQFEGQRERLRARLG